MVLTSRIFTRSPTVNVQSIAVFSAPVSPIDEPPDHVRGVGPGVDLRHEVFPLQPVTGVVRVVIVMVVASVAGVSAVSLGTSFMPHLGQVPGSPLVTSGCIGQT